MAICTICCPWLATNRKCPAESVAMARGVIPAGTAELPAVRDTLGFTV